MKPGINYIFAEIPKNLVSVENLVLEAGMGNEVVRKLNDGGLRQIPVSEKSSLLEFVRSLMVRVVKGMPAHEFRNISFVMFAHSLPILAPLTIPFLNLCFNHIGLSDVPKVAISGQPCAIMHTAVDLCSEMIRTKGNDERILLVGADMVYSAKDRIFFGSAMGDSAIALVFAKNSTANRVLGSYCDTKLFAYNGEDSPQEMIAKFRQFNPINIRHAIQQCLGKANLHLKDIKYIFPHTPYVQIWDVIADSLPYPRDRIFTENISQTGHLNSNDSFYHFYTARKNGFIDRGDIVMLINPGFGGSRGCTIIQV